MDYERGLNLLKQRLAGTEALADFDLLESRWWDNMGREKFGSTETTRAERMAILEDFNKLARTHLGRSFNDLCQPNLSATSSPPPRTRAPNPFRSTGRVTDPAAFVGRDALLHELFSDLRRGVSRALLGESQVGKSSILEMICKQGPQRFHRPSSDFIYLDMQLIHREDDFFEALCAELGIEPCPSFKLSRMLRGKRYILCLDEIEKMRKEHFSGNERETLRGLADGADMPFTLVVANRVPLEDLFPDLLGNTSALAHLCTALVVPPFTSDEAHLFLAQRLNGTGITFTPTEIEDLIERSGGHPARLQRAAAEVYRRYAEE